MACVCICICIYTCIYRGPWSIYIYIYREREKEREADRVRHIWIYIYIYMCMFCVVSFRPYEYESNACGGSTSHQSWRQIAGPIVAAHNLSSGFLPNSAQTNACAAHRTQCLALLGVWPCRKLNQLLHNFVCCRPCPAAMLPMGLALVSLLVLGSSWPVADSEEGK